MNNHNVPWKIVLLVLGVSGVLVTVMMAAYREFGSSGLEAVSIFSSSLLTLSLVLLYWQQHQALRYQQKPLLEIGRLELHDNLQVVSVDLSNYGGGAATSLALEIELHDLDGSPIDTVRGKLRRIESIDDGVTEKTRSSSIRPSELAVNFEVKSATTLPMGGPVQGQDSLARVLVNELEDRDVVYGKLIVTYATQFSEENESEADFSLKFTQQDSLKYEAMDFQPWTTENERAELGG